ncbi:MAG: DUF1538 family protein [Spirochaetes bacterium]|nr:DUF1538 family protein [Spirochaetota bacterium]
MATQQATGKVNISLKQAFGMLGPYAWAKILDQIKSVSLIVVYLVLFQVLILGVPIANASILALGIGVVIIGLAFFMEGLFLGLMPLGETCGVKLPQKTVLPVILIFAFLLGVGATFAEPAIGVLKQAGSSVTAWDAPLLFLLLNKNSGLLVWAVGAGVGIAVLFGMLRFMYNWSLKPFIYVLYAIAGALSIWSYFEPNMVYLTGLAWDCGGVTTGPVTVPLVLALGIGICRAATKGDAGSSGGGFGVVTLASAFPIIAVLGLGLIFLGSVPKPMSAVKLFSTEQRDKTLKMFDSEDAMRGYALLNASYDAQLAAFNNDTKSMLAFVTELGTNAAKRTAVAGGDAAFTGWLLKRGSQEQRIAVYGSPEAVKAAIDRLSAAPAVKIDFRNIFVVNGLGALQAIVPLSLFLLFALFVILREKLKRADEIFLGILFAVVGMTLFSIGITLGLSRLGEDVGKKLPSSFKAIEMAEQTQVIRNFNPAIVNKAISPDGSVDEFFYKKAGTAYAAFPYRSNNFDPHTAQYVYTPTRGPLFGGVMGIVIVLFFGFMMGYGATLAEPALNALGATVEELTVGSFKKSLLMQAVAIGVGVGIAVGVAKIIYGLPLIWLLVPPYLILMVLTILSSEEFVNIGWDSAGVTTGPVTVPLVLAMGLGIGGQVGVVEGFGILALASVYPILSVLCVGLFVTMKRKSALKEVTTASSSAAA